MAFRNKFSAVESYSPDILVIQESENPQDLLDKKANLPWDKQVWIWDNLAKGLSVFARSDLSLQIRACYRPEHRFVAPVKVGTSAGNFDLLALWTQAEKRQSESYVAHSINAFERGDYRLNPFSILASDFNSSQVWTTDYHIADTGKSASKLSSCA